jgi:hypothetical protein
MQKAKNASAKCNCKMQNANSKKNNKERNKQKNTKEPTTFAMRHAGTENPTCAWSYTIIINKNN